MTVRLYHLHVTRGRWQLDVEQDFGRDTPESGNRQKGTRKEWQHDRTNIESQDVTLPVVLERTQRARQATSAAPRCDSVCREGWVFGNLAAMCVAECLDIV